MCDKKYEHIGMINKPLVQFHACGDTMGFKHLDIQIIV